MERKGAEAMYLKSKVIVRSDHVVVDLINGVAGTFLHISK